ncbi:histidine kinase dimerization/phospho-acceptor domain-containing protein [Hydrogenophaga sp.]|uniref:histidine kinase dimerization/phospho-acceptor domain-containing protein n=1 Tax=Hydrogenophaga sp. TaxID=1904254 RepID=UPI0025BE9E01|nr:histidine kinase dimerization/phospho-acceptor domain-containing protein [Hydrogenophaga sp.]MBT9465588.1 sensor histidine kinase N-terminal domain-containing protein [Hydrogenophaga sp.]
MKTSASLTGHLLTWTLGALFLVWACFIAFAYQAGQREADELTDGHLASTSTLLAAWAHGQPLAGQQVAAPAGTLPLQAHDYQRSLSVVIWDAQGSVVARSGDAPVPDFAVAEEGFSTLALGQPAVDWRGFARWNADRSRKVMVLLSVPEHDALARDIAQQIIEPGLWLLPAVALALGLAIRRGLRPLYEMSGNVHDLDIHQAEALPLPRHEELAAVVDAVNRLVQRYHAALTRERDLASEFAHELRTPLTALALQARGARDLHEGASRVAAIAHIEQQALRAGEVLTQLLALARAGRAELDETAEPVDVTELARHVVGDYAPQAHAGGRELSLAADAPLRVSGHRTLLELALRNLVENSLSHTPPGTHVEVCVKSLERCVHVRDRWPAQAAVSERAEGPALGLGLGHRVVAKVAEIHGASFEAHTGSPLHGRGYGIVFR